MDNWTALGIGTIFACLQVGLFFSARSRQAKVLSQLVELTSNPSKPVTRFLVDQLRSGNWQWQLLRRFTVMAPMIGVVLTAIGFLRLPERFADGSATNVVAGRISFVGAMSPLYHGVLVGAVLALMSQMLVFLLDIQFQSGLGALDTVGATDSNSGASIEGVIQTFADEIRQVISVLRKEASDTVAECMGIVDSTTSGLLALGTEFEKMQLQLQKTTENHSASSHETTARIGEVSRLLSDSAQQFRHRLDLISAEFGQIPAHVKRVNQELAGFVDGMTDQSRIITTRFTESLAVIPQEISQAIQPLQSTVRSMEESFVNWKSITTHYGESAQRLSESIQMVESSAELFSGMMTDKLQPEVNRAMMAMSATGRQQEELGERTQRLARILTESSVGFQKGEQDLVSAVDSLQKSLAPLGRLTDSIQAALVQNSSVLQDAPARLNQSLQDLAKSLGDTAVGHSQNLYQMARRDEEAIRQELIAAYRPVLQEISGLGATLRESSQVAARLVGTVEESRAKQERELTRLVAAIEQLPTMLRMGVAEHQESSSFSETAHAIDELVNLSRAQTVALDQLLVVISSQTAHDAKFRDDHSEASAKRGRGWWRF
jgi:hypothetical protein